MHDAQLALSAAIRIAATAHYGQFDKAGAAYILHPLRVMAKMKTTDEMIAAVLHDVPEDCPDWSLDILAAHGLAPHIIAALDALTKRKGETRMDAARRAALNPIALQVKLADNWDNSDISRIKKPTSKDRARMCEYAEVRAALLSCVK
jgi:(p)ppGpp synthase/HD superfamily hydrolase